MELLLFEQIKRLGTIQHSKTKKDKLLNFINET
jgi:hypothetical protein